MKRELWTATISKSSAPAWPCPECGKHALKLTNKTLVQQETTRSKHAHAHPDWDPDWITTTFVVWLKCPDVKCGQDVAVIGEGSVEPMYDPEDGMSWEEIYAPRFALPMPDMFEVPAKCPDEVTNDLRAAFRSFWSDAPAASNRLRNALERLMDHLGVKKRERDGQGRLIDLSLHKRIMEFRTAEPVLGDHLLALKWLGNSGSHSTSVTREEVLDAFEVIEHCLVEILMQRTKRIAALAKQMTKNHAPRKRKV